MRASRMVTAVVAAALAGLVGQFGHQVPAATGSDKAPAVSQGFPTQGSQVIAATAPRDPSTGLPSGKRQY